VLDAPADDTIAGLRDRAILSAGLKVGLRRAEIAALKVGDLHQNRGCDSFPRRAKGRSPRRAGGQSADSGLVEGLSGGGRLRGDVDGPLFGPLLHNGKQQDERRRMDPDAIDRVVRKHAGELWLDRAYSAHSMRVTFITTARVIFCDVPIGKTTIERMRKQTVRQRHLPHERRTKSGG
jgi:integrase